MRQFAILPAEAYGVVTENRAQLQRLLAMNIEAEKPGVASSAIAEMMLSFFSGLCIERNLRSGKASSTRKIENLMTALRNLQSEPTRLRFGRRLASPALAGSVRTSRFTSNANGGSYVAGNVF
jgi:hypothetical protein